MEMSKSFTALLRVEMRKQPLLGRKRYEPLRQRITGAFYRSSIPDPIFYRRDALPQEAPESYLRLAGEPVKDPVLVPLLVRWLIGFLVRQAIRRAWCRYRGLFQ